jgi:threonine aldolase
MIDLHSDTVTQPTKEMREAMRNAVVGDDVYEADPTVNALEARIAQMFQKDAALFFPSGTMSNLAAVLAWCPHRGSEIIVGDKSHIFLYEQAGVSQFGGISMRAVRNSEDGSMSLDEMSSAIRDDDIHEPSTGLICIENTHNACGGKVLSMTFLKNLRDMSIENGISIHMDGARIWNAIAASGREPHEIAKYASSITVCLSKGLGCPVGSVLVGPRDFIRSARRIRKGLGGGMRQAGVLAAAGLVGLDDFAAGILQLDHFRTRRIVNEIDNMRSFQLMTPVVTTNILFLVVLHGNSYLVEDMLRERNVLISVWSHNLIRIVIHRDIDDTMIDKVIVALKDVSDILYYREAAPAIL